MDWSLLISIVALGVGIVALIFGIRGTRAGERALGLQERETAASATSERVSEEELQVLRVMEDSDEVKTGYYHEGGSVCAVKQFKPGCLTNVSENDWFRQTFAALSRKGFIANRDLGGGETAHSLSDDGRKVLRFNRDLKIQERAVQWGKPIP